MKDPVSENPSAVHVLMSPKKVLKTAVKHFDCTFSSYWGNELEKLIFSHI